MKICGLTTIDNKWDYFRQHDEWEAHENITGQRTLKALGRCAFTSSDLSYEQYAKEVERAIDDIIAKDPVGIFVKVSTEVPDP